jgi:hypothetical protein
MSTRVFVSWLLTQRLGEFGGYVPPWPLGEDIVRGW